MFKKCEFTEWHRGKLNDVIAENVRLQSRVSILEKKLSTLSKHLDVTFDWVECRPHYEIKENENKSQNK